MKKLVILTGGGDCPGLNAVIRATTRAALATGEWEVYGSREAFNGFMEDPVKLIPLDHRAVAGIHYRGGTILGTTNKGDPFSFPQPQADGSYKVIDRSEEIMAKVRDFGVDAVLSVGGDGSQRISQRFFEMGMPIIGVPKTIDNDLSGTDMTFGFQTAVQIATEGVDKLVTTAESHNRIMILEVMGRSAGWIALHTAIAGGAEVCLIPEIPYRPERVVERLHRRYEAGKGFANIVIAEGAIAHQGEVVARESGEVGYQHKRLGGVGYRLAEELKHRDCPGDIRVTVLGHLQRGGIPIAFDRVLATTFGVRAFQLAAAGKFGRMVALRNNAVTDVPITEAIDAYNFVDPDGYLVETARAIGISFGE